MNSDTDTKNESSILDECSLLDAERKFIRDNHRNPPYKESENWVGMALSGGGI